MNTSAGGGGRRRRLEAAATATTEYESPPPPPPIASAPPAVTFARGNYPFRARFPSQSSEKSAAAAAAAAAVFARSCAFLNATATVVAVSGGSRRAFSASVRGGGRGQAFLPRAPKTPPPPPAATHPRRPLGAPRF